MQTWKITISKEFWDDLAKLPSNISPKAFRTLNRMQEDPWAREFHPEKIKQAEEGIYSSRVDEKYRIIWKHIKPTDIVFCLVDNHDEAYARAARKTFVLQDGMVKLGDVLEDGARVLEQEKGLFGWTPKKERSYGMLFVSHSDDELLGMGVPDGVLRNVRALDNVNQLESVERLFEGNEEVYNRLLELALDLIDRPTAPDKTLAKSLERYQGGDALYRFVDTEEFQRALAGDLADWMLFLAPTQRYLVFREFNGPARVKGIAGSGKTVVALHRIKYLARKAHEKERKVLFLTFGNRLPGVSEHLLARLMGDHTLARNAVECTTLHKWCRRYLSSAGLFPNVNKDFNQGALSQALQQTRKQFNTPSLFNRPETFFQDEIKYVIKGRNVRTEDEYLALERSGRGTALQTIERKAMFAVYQSYQQTLTENRMWDWEDFLVRSLALCEQGHPFPENYAHIIADEIQDFTEATMRLLRAIVPAGPNDLFLVGDGLQRIYPGGYSMSRVGIEVIGRSTLLRKNYRNTHEILRAAHALMKGTKVDDLEDTSEEIPEPEYSVRCGPLPVLKGFSSPQAEIQWVFQEIQRLHTQDGIQPKDVVFVYRMSNPYKDLINQIGMNSFQIQEIQDNPNTIFGPGIKHTTFHSIKGLEFKVVFVVGVTDGQFVPRDDWTLDDAALEEYLSRERQLLYVAMTRARDRLYLTYSRGQSSRFLNNIPAEYLQRM
jgi:superfamily I DNA/RNA helicase/mRNA-degrading endonuclease RelE of RelBE toxin-antitoxin system